MVIMFEINEEKSELGAHDVSLLVRTVQGQDPCGRPLVADQGAPCTW